MSYRLQTPCKQLAFWGRKGGFSEELLAGDVPAMDAVEKVAGPVKEDDPTWDREGESKSLGLHRMAEAHGGTPYAERHVRW
jgi:hypothetical protein